MAEMIAYCGNDCETCPALIATRQNDFELRKKTAVEWSKTYGHEIKPEEINCIGCRNEGSHISYCDTMCEIRKCARSRKLENCAHCPDYGCPTISAFLKNAEEARIRLEAIRAAHRV